MKKEKIYKKLLIIMAFFAIMTCSDVENDNHVVFTANLELQRREIKSADCDSTAIAVSERGFFGGGFEEVFVCRPRRSLPH